MKKHSFRICKGLIKVKKESILMGIEIKLLGMKVHMIETKMIHSGM